MSYFQLWDIDVDIITIISSWDIDVESMLIQRWDIDIFLKSNID